MKISTKGRYTTRAMLELALRQDSSPVNLKDIAQAQQVSVKYLENLFTLLKKAKLVKSTIGMSGGYVLTKSPDKIRMQEIVEAMEGDLAPTECVSNPKTCSRSTDCATREVWEKVGYAVKKVLSSITLQDLVNKTKNNKRFSRRSRRRK